MTPALLNSRITKNKIYAKKIKNLPKSVATYSNHLIGNYKTGLFPMCKIVKTWNSIPPPLYLQAIPKINPLKKALTAHYRRSYSQFEYLTI